MRVRGSKRQPRGGAEYSESIAERSSHLGKSLLELLFFIFGSGVCDCLADHLTTLFDRILAARAVEEDGVILGNGEFLACTQHIKLGRLEFHTHILGDYSSTCEDCHVLQRCLAVITKARSLTSCCFNDSS